jgi:membrane protease YdiL (CAAX protease family)
MSRNTKGIVVFVLIAFGIAWLNMLVLWIAGIVPPEDAEAGQPDPLLIVLGLPWAFAPAIAAVVVRKWVTREGFSAAGAGLKPRLRTGWPTYLAALLFPLIVLSIAVGLWTLVSGGRPDWSALSAEMVPIMLVMTLVMAFYYLGEEYGWRGYLQQKLAPRRPLLAALGTGLIWGVWHYGLVLFGFPGYENMLMLLIHPINSVLVSILYGWLVARGKSVWPACLAHAADNMFVGGLLSVLMAGVPEILAWGGYGLAGYAVLSLLVIAFGRYRAGGPRQTKEAS